MNDLDAKRAELRTLLQETESKLEHFRNSDDPARISEIPVLELGVAALHVQLRELGASR